MSIALDVRSIMTKDIVSVENSSSVREAVSLMIKKNIGSIVVNKNGKPVGILTERDIMKRCYPKNTWDDRVEEYMSTPLITIEADAAIGEAASIMADKDIRRLLVTERGKIVGIITQKDVMRGTLNVFMTLASI